LGNTARPDLAIRQADSDDVSAIAALFGRAFDDYQRGFGVSAAALGRLWEPSLRARVASTTVAMLPDRRVAGFVVTGPPGATERYGDRSGRSDQARAWRREMRAAAFWRLPLFFIPMGLAYSRRRARKDELYVSLIAVAPELQGRGESPPTSPCASPYGRIRPLASRGLPPRRAGRRYPTIPCPPSAFRSPATGRAATPVPG
jgi:hypothetical protein